MTASLPRIDTPQALRALARAVAPKACDCPLRRCAPWDSIAEGNWPQQHMTAVATLRDPDLEEPTFLEFHPQGTRYDAADAPVALRFFPYNRCDVWHCSRCGQHWLRYTEFGGYYIDHRSRRLDPARVVDAPLP